MANIPNTNVSLDIETLSTRGDAVVLSLGICIFELNRMQSFDEIVDKGTEMFFDPEEQISRGRHVSNDTMEWWGKQGEDARRVLDSPKELQINPRQFFSAFDVFCQTKDINMAYLQNQARWFARGPTFDMSILESLFGSYNVSTPWKFWLVRDIRTHLEALGLDTSIQLRRPKNMVHHNALHDAAYDVWALQQLLHKPFDKLDIEEKKREAVPLANPLPHQIPLI